MQRLIIIVVIGLALIVLGFAVSRWGEGPVKTGSNVQTTTSGPTAPRPLGTSTLSHGGPSRPRDSSKVYSKGVMPQHLQCTAPEESASMIGRGSNGR